MPHCPDPCSGKTLSSELRTLYTVFRAEGRGEVPEKGACHELWGGDVVGEWNMGCIREGEGSACMGEGLGQDSWPQFGLVYVKLDFATFDSSS